MLETIFQTLSKKYQPSSIAVYRNTINRIFRDGYGRAPSIDLFKNFEKFKVYLGTVQPKQRRSIVYTVILILNTAGEKDTVLPYQKLYDSLTHDSISHNVQSHQIKMMTESLREKPRIVLEKLHEALNKAKDVARRDPHDHRAQRDYLVLLLYDHLPLKGRELSHLRIAFVEYPRAEIQMFSLIGPFYNKYSRRVILGNQRGFNVTPEIADQFEKVSGKMPFYGDVDGLVKRLTGHSVAEIRREYIRSHMISWSKLPVEEFDVLRERLARQMGHSIEAQTSLVN